MTAYKQILDGHPDGTKIGVSTDLIGMYGATPVAQASAITSPGSTASTASSPVGFGSTTQADAIVTAVRSIVTALKNVGITA